MPAINADSARDQFMQLLVTQLQNQDPLEPVGQQEFIQQLSQFSMLEGIERLNASFESILKVQTLAQGAELVGRTVEYLDNEGTTQQGVVQSATVKDGALQLKIDDREIPIDLVKGVVTPAA